MFHFENEDINFKQHFLVGFGLDLVPMLQTILQCFSMHTVLSRAQSFRWFEAFSEGGERIGDQPSIVSCRTARTDQNVASFELE